MIVLVVRPKVAPSSTWVAETGSQGRRHAQRQHHLCQHGATRLHDERSKDKCAGTACGQHRRFTHYEVVPETTEPGEPPHGLSPGRCPGCTLRPLIAATSRPATAP